MLDRRWFTLKEREAYRRRTALEREATQMLRAADRRQNKSSPELKPAPATIELAAAIHACRPRNIAKTGTGAMRHREILQMKEPKACGKRELHVLFTRLATLIEAYEGDGDDFIDEEVEPIVERFIDEYFCDVEPQHIMTYLLVWFVQWRASRGQWAMSSTA
jgi:hypothetical protein